MPGRLRDARFGDVAVCIDRQLEPNVPFDAIAKSARRVDGVRVRL